MRLARDIIKPQAEPLSWPICKLRKVNATGVFAAGLKNGSGSGYPLGRLAVALGELQTSQPGKRPLQSARTHYRGTRLNLARQYDEPR